MEAEGMAQELFHLFLSKALAQNNMIRRKHVLFNQDILHHG